MKLLLQFNEVAHICFKGLCRQWIESLSRNGHKHNKVRSMFRVLIKVALPSKLAMESS